MSENKQYDIQEPKDSLHWISYNLKQLVKELKNITPILADIRDKGNSAPRKSEDIPF